MSRTRNWTPDPLTKLKAVVTSVKKRQRLGANNGNVIPHPDFLSAREGGKLYNHFQGIQRYGKYVIISGGISSGSRNLQGSQLIVIQMGAKNPSMPWGYPRYQPAASSYDYKHPDPRDKVVAVIPLDRTLWHAGGIQMMGRILAVPLYGKMPDGRPRSHVRFYDFSVPTRPTEIREMRITRPKKAFAVALAGLPDKRTLAIVWDDKTLDFYYSRTPGAKKWKPAIEVPGKRIPKFHQKDQKQYQCINLVVDSSSKDFFLVGFHNTNKLSPLSTDYFRPG